MLDRILVLGNAMALTCMFSYKRRCVKERGEDAEECKFYQKAYRSLCPDQWVSCLTSLPGSTEQFDFAKRI